VTRKGGAQGDMVGVVLRAVRPEGPRGRTSEALRSPFRLSPSGLRLWGDKKRPFGGAQGDKKKGAQGDKKRGLRVTRKGGRPEGRKARRTSLLLSFKS